MNPDALHQLNSLSAAEATEQFRKCCGTQWWCEQMAACRPFHSVDQLHGTADAIFDEMAEGHWLEAFACHPTIGDLNSLRMKLAGNRQWSGSEQAGVSEADEPTLLELTEANKAYKAKFGYIFIVCATGKSAGEMLGLLKARLRNDPAREAPIACAEQRKITHLRLDKLTLD